MLFRKGNIVALVAKARKTINGDDGFSAAPPAIHTLAAGSIRG